MDTEILPRPGDGADDSDSARMVAAWQACVRLNIRFAARVMCRARCQVLRDYGACDCLGDSGWRDYADLATALFRHTMLNLSRGDE
jgi:hypothetical protein